MPKLSTVGGVIVSVRRGFRCRRCANEISLAKSQYSATVNLISIASLAATLLFATPFAIAQNRFTLSGSVKSAQTGESLIGANIVVQELKNTGASSNAYGFFSLRAPEGRYTILVQYLGYQTKKDSLVLDQDRTVNFELVPEPIKIRKSSFRDRGRI